MQVFKFGGASVKNPEGVRNLLKIIESHPKPLVVVVSAMGKTTNALELVLYQYLEKEKGVIESYQRVVDYHMGILLDLFPEGHEAFGKLNRIFAELQKKLSTEPGMSYNFEYDQLVSYGEILSTTIIAEFLKHSGIDCEWVDIRKVLKTDNSYREARVNFELSQQNVTQSMSGSKVYLTQGFIGSDENNLTTTLGREGSDYTGALLAYFLDAESLTVWKDVPGVLNADPKWFSNTVKLDKISYTDAIELAFYGASVIHPKTIQPLKKKNISLWVKSFYEPEMEGTIIGDVTYEKLIPSFIFKMDQVLIDIYPNDLSFIAEENLHLIFKVLANYNLRVNLMQNTAVHFRVCVNNDKNIIPKVVEELKGNFHVTTSMHLELITIRYFDQATIDRVMVNKEMILEQRTRNTIQLLVKDLN
ncbi:MAG: aspartate kinase [Bacteroidales bacterium]|nr:aspartate kinase [Bacteroidales bacterium]